MRLWQRGSSSARTVLQWLVLYRGNDPRSWRGLAASAHALEDYGQALLHWTLVASSPTPWMPRSMPAAARPSWGGCGKRWRPSIWCAAIPAPTPALRQQAEQMLALLQQRRAA